MSYHKQERAFSVSTLAVHQFVKNLMCRI